MGHFFYVLVISHHDSLVHGSTIDIYFDVVGDLSLGPLQSPTESMLRTSLDTAD